MYGGGSYDDIWGGGKEYTTAVDGGVGDNTTESCSKEVVESTLKKRHTRSRHMPNKVLSVLLEQGLIVPEDDDDTITNTEHLLLDLRTRYPGGQNVSSTASEDAAAQHHSSKIERIDRDKRAKAEVGGKLRRITHNAAAAAAPPQQQPTKDGGNTTKPFHFEVDWDQLSLSFSQCGRQSTKTSAAQTSQSLGLKAMTVNFVAKKAILDDWGIPVPDSCEPPPSFHSSKLGFPIVAPYDLYWHQMEAIRHAQQCERECHRGMVGSVKDLEMGLGKSLIAASLSVLDLAAGTCRAPTLILCPLALIESWVLDTFLKFFPQRYRLMVWRKELLGKRWDTMTRETLHGFDFVITNYDMISSVAKAEHLLDQTTTTKSKKGAAAPSKKPPPPTKNAAADQCGSALLFTTEWHRIIADESQNFLNVESQLYRAMMLLKARYKLCLTGTPFRNYDSDLLSPFQWLGYRDTPRPKDWNKARFDAHSMGKVMHIMGYEAAQIKLPALQTRIVSFTLVGEALILYNLVADMVKRKHDSRQSDTFTALQLWRQVCVAPFLITAQASSLLSAQPSAAEERLLQVMDLPEGPERRQAVERYLSLDPSLARDGRLSALLLSLGNLCSRDELLSTILRVVCRRKAAASKKEVEGEEEVSSSSSSSPHVGPPEYEKAYAVARNLDTWLIDQQGTSGQQSGKMMALLDLVRYQIASTEKIIVFSTFSKAVELVAKILQQHTIAYELLTGQTKKVERHFSLQRFRVDPQCRVLLMTYGVGSVGLNLQEATHVIHLEPWWNSIDARQGTCRAHRIGQTREVCEWYLLAENSIEPRIRKMCDDKEQRGKELLGQNDALSGGGHLNFSDTTTSDAEEMRTLMALE